MVAEPRPPRACHCAADVQPLVGRGLRGADGLADAIHEDFRPSARQAAQARRLQPLQDRADRQPRGGGDVDDLRRAETVDVQPRKAALDVAEQLLVPRQVQRGVHAALQEDLVAAQGDGLFDLAEQFLAAEDVAAGLARRSRKGAEAAAAEADVGVVDVAIDVVGP